MACGVPVRIALRSLANSKTIASRPVSTNVHPGYKQLKEKQKQWMYGDGIPVHIKGGDKDKFFYAITMMGCAVGLGMILYNAYELAVPKKK